MPNGKSDFTMGDPNYYLTATEEWSVTILEHSKSLEPTIEEHFVNNIRAIS